IGATCGRALLRRGGFEDWGMDVVTLLTVAVLVGWLATLILQGKNDDVYVCDFSIAVTGAALAGGLIAPSLGISPTGQYGLTLAGTFASWAGATARSEEHTSELQSPYDLVCRLLLEK